MGLPRAKKSLGQHFLIDERVLRRIVDYAGIQPEDAVLEIGPGPGNLTRALSERAREVVAIEVDAALARALEREMPENVRVVHADAVKAEWPPFDLQVSNLPYQVSSPILFKLLDTPGWRGGVLLVQKEFADRLVAKPGTKEYGRLTVGCALHADVERLERVPPGAFHPPPRVTSAVIRLTPRPPPFPIRSPRHAELYLGAAHAAFTNRRKKLANALQSGAHLVGMPRAALEAALLDLPHAGIRPDALSPVQFAEVAAHLLDAEEQHG